MRLPCPSFFKIPVSRPVLETSFDRVHMAKVIIELEEQDFMEVLSTLTEIRDTLARVETTLAVNHSVTDKEPETEKRIRSKRNG